MNEPGWIDIGGGHFIRFVEYNGDMRAGIRDKHLTIDGKPCQGFIAIEGAAWADEFKSNPIPAWKVESWEPLTLSPSVLCRTCGDHGFIRGGRWVKA
jgi:hypothetical protein